MSDKTKALEATLDKLDESVRHWERGREFGYLVGLHDALRAAHEHGDADTIMAIERLINEAVK